MLTTLLDILGAALVVTGVALIFIPAAFIVGGVALVAISYNLTRRSAELVPE